MNLENIWRNILEFITSTGPRLVATSTFLPCGLSLGYILVSLHNGDGALQYGPLFIGLVAAFACAAGLVATKFIYDQVVFWHFDVLLVAAFFNLLGGCLFFIHDLDTIAAFCVFLAHGLTYVSSLSYLHIAAPTKTRTIYLASCFTWYIVGIAAGTALIGGDTSTSTQNSDSNLYTNFAILFLLASLLITVMLVVIRVLHEMGSIEYKTMLDEELRIANSMGRIFENRKNVINRVRDTKSFFYVTRNNQWWMSFILVVCEAVYSGLFAYYIYWFSVNPAVKLTSEPDTLSFIMLAVLLGGITSTVLMIFFTIKIIFVVAVCSQIGLTILGLILFPTTGTLVPFWIVAVLFGIMFPCIKVAVVETSPFRYTEVLILICFVIQLVPIGIINLYFLGDSFNAYFLSTDRSVLVANGLSFLVIISLLSIIVALQVPRLFKTSLWEIQYQVFGITFTEHNIEQLNIGYLQSGKIPTKIENVDSMETASV